eukprot:1553823-Rhodomonas_salina.2
MLALLRDESKDGVESAEVEMELHKSRRSVTQLNGAMLMIACCDVSPRFPRNIEAGGIKSTPPRADNGEDCAAGVASVDAYYIRHSGQYKNSNRNSTGFLPKETAEHHRKHILRLVKEAIKEAQIKPVRGIQVRWSHEPTVLISCGVLAGRVGLRLLHKGARHGWAAAGLCRCGENALSGFSAFPDRSSRLHLSVSWKACSSQGGLLILR